MLATTPLIPAPIHLGKPIDEFVEIGLLLPKNRAAALLQLAREGMQGSYPVGGRLRHTWVFKLSELSQAIDPKLRLPTYSRDGMIAPGAPR